MEDIVFKPKSRQELELLKTLGKKMGIQYSTAQRTTSKRESDSSFVPGNPAKAKKAMKKVFGMWADREDMEDVQEWRRKLWERES